MATYTLDCSSVLALILLEAHSEAARSFFRRLTPDDELISPAFLLVECTSVIRSRVFRGALTHQEGEEALEKAIALPVRSVSTSGQHTLALRIAGQRRMTRAYDSHYLAVAALENAELVTVDGGMYQGAVELRIAAQLLR